MPFSDDTIKFAGRAAMGVAGLLLTCIVFPLQAEEIYRSVDAQGHVVYSDRPAAVGAKKTEVAVQQADPKEAERLAKERLLLKAEDEQRSRQQTQDSQAKAQQDALKKQACKSARDRYANLNSVNRIFTTGADGNREYYTDAQADAMRAEAKRAMDAACGS